MIVTVFLHDESKYEHETFDEVRVDLPANVVKIVVESHTDAQITVVDSSGKIVEDVYVEESSAQSYKPWRDLSEFERQLAYFVYKGVVCIDYEGPGILHCIPEPGYKRPDVETRALKYHDEYKSAAGACTPELDEMDIEEIDYMNLEFVEAWFEGVEEIPEFVPEYDSSLFTTKYANLQALIEDL
ncbi:CUN075 putative p35 apoptosis inhibitor, similar to AcMNPV ORF135 [Culex nigripalpus nucleopolyhedrovirus]|uniref:CUN075 putative p35 apoptosis inhibitor, similar to AcMNPV ORF135 n=1 Tax=Culex nigripalpus nucleopolyhedrovirus (isolate Florida/1997) TaxID=645993 RepID=Q919K1_NPVCO|nr:CUN075 putative p35 apoptosis inhibitor, similar to AcMNPV ORF135 [Culex nigripalpus nucleopolyhedrovirus]AAK94153.1 CUN075 putative p35 apoptosis inhibitor, similar to AcMNPV ORF135 [Culex nigripalpus nucleopolyhedrovirus]